MRRRPLLLGACVFVLGLLYENRQGWYFPILVSVLAIYASLPFLTVRSYRKGVLRCLWIAAVFVAGILHMRVQTAFRSAELAKIYDGETISLCGKIYRKEFKNDQLLVYLKNCYAVSNTEQFACNQVLLYQTSDEYSIGDILFVNGQLNRFQSAANEGAFDAESYYFSQKLDFAVKQADVALAEPAQSRVAESMWQLRQRISCIYTEAADDVTAGVLSVMILGEKSMLDADVKELYQSMGISHILAISGLHVSLIGLGIYRFFRRRGMRHGSAFVLSGVLLVLYALMTGAGVSTKRAVGMLFILMLADVWGRAYDSLNALGAMILVLLWQNPFLLEYAGFILSVAAVLGVATIGVAIQTGEKTETKKGKGYARKIMNAAYMGVGIWLFTLPLIAYYYYEIPLYSALLNLFVVPFLKYLVLLGAAGAVAGVGGMFCLKDVLAGKFCISAASSRVPAIVTLILYPCRFILRWYDTAANVCLRLPFARIIVGKPSASRLILYYVSVAVFSVIWQKRKERHWIRLAGVAAILAVLLCPSPAEFELDVLDVGQGDGTYICSEEGISIFVDGGSSNVGSVGTYQILPFLKSKGIRKISYWFVSHADADHISGLLEVLESGYPVENLILGNRTVSDDSRDALIAQAAASGTNVLCMKTGDMLDLGKTTITCLSPDAENAYEDRNDGGLVLLYRDAQFSAMFAGDIPREVEESIVMRFAKETVLEGGLLDVDFYKADHHGSKYSSCEQWLQALTPEVTTISCSSTNTYGHPHADTLERLEAIQTEIYRTDELGAIRLTIEDGVLSVSGYKETD